MTGHEEPTTPDPSGSLAATKGRSPQAAVEASHLRKRFGAVEAVRDLSFRVPDRTVCGLLGPNGAGKSTTIRMLAGLLIPDAGELRVVGHDMRRDAEAARRQIGYLPESAPAHPELRTREFLRYRASLVGLTGRRAADAIDRAVVACSLQTVFGRLVGALSKGFRQRVGLAAAILGDPRLVILDEPSVGLDPHQLIEFRRLVRDLGRERSVLLSSHIMAEIEAVCDRAVLIANGCLVAEGSMEELRGTGGTLIVVEVGGVDWREVVLGLSALATCELLPDGWARVKLPLPGESREAVCSTILGKGVALRELRLERASLETLFVRSTRAEGAA